MYSRASLIKAAYQFTDSAYILLDANDTYYTVDISNKDGSSDANLVDRFKNELLTQSAREIVSHQTKEIRELLMARAFASTVVYSDEKWILPDPPAVNENLNSILMDWFDKYESK